MYYLISEVVNWEIAAPLKSCSATQATQTIKMVNLNKLINAVTGALRNKTKHEHIFQ